MFSLDSRFDMTQRSTESTTWAHRPWERSADSILRGGGWIDIGRTEIIFSHVDQNRAGLDLPEHNFVFGENFRAILGGLLSAREG